MRFKISMLLGALVALGLLAVTAGAGVVQPLPKVAKGATISVAATGASTPTGFAFGDGQTFVSDGSLPTGGGVFVLKGRALVRVAGSPAGSFGVAWHKGKLYVSALGQLLVWSGWNGTGFASQKILYTAPKRFPGLNGIAFGPDGRLYAGVDVGQSNDHGPATAPFQYDVISMTASGKHIKVFAKGMRQPWQLAFAPGSRSPFVSDLGQDAGVNNPPDFLLRVSKGQDYGFPKCNWVKPKACQKFARPFKFFAPHTSVMGLAILGRRLYMSEFGAAKVVSMPLHGGSVKTLASGFTAPIVGLGVHGKSLYVGQTATSATALGFIYKITP